MGMNDMVEYRCSIIDTSSIWGVNTLSQRNGAVDAHPSPEEFSSCLTLYLNSFFLDVIPDSKGNTTDSQSIPDILYHVKKTFSLSIMELSSILDVSRPTIYAYMKGDSQPENDVLLSRLMVLEEFAQAVEKSGLDVSYASSILSRRDSGFSLKDWIRKDIFVTENIPAYIAAERNDKEMLAIHVASLMKKRKRKDGNLPFITPYAFPEEPDV